MADNLYNRYNLVEAINSNLNCLMEIFANDNYSKSLRKIQFEKMDTKQQVKRDDGRYVILLAREKGMLSTIKTCFTVNFYPTLLCKFLIQSISIIVPMNELNLQHRVPSDYSASLTPVIL